VAILGLRRGKHVDMECILMDCRHIVCNGTNVGSSSSSLDTYLKVWLNLLSIVIDFGFIFSAHILI
jgi:hypothetical protein